MLRLARVTTDRPAVRAGTYPRGVDTRRALGSWLAGPKAVEDPVEAEAPAQLDGYRGERLGLPADGTGSLAGFGRRLAALCVDWALSLLVARLVIRDLGMDATARPSATLLVFAVEVALLTWLGGASFGQRVLRVRVVGLSRRMGALGALIRTLLLVLVIPPLVYDRDGRGLHDKAVGTAVVRM